MTARHFIVTFPPLPYSAKSYSSSTGRPSSVCDGPLIFRNIRFIDFVLEVHFNLIYAKIKLLMECILGFRCVPVYTIWVQIVSLLDGFSGNVVSVVDCRFPS